ncbi:hypothetical protein ApAK_08810 [Thermoplasmatales archaeon AK]|nr:hypothetical protein [Thermoplasmatales archaeon AK]
MSFLSSLMNILLGFFHSLASTFSADLQYEMAWFGYQVGSLFLTWGSSFSAMGILMPTVLVAVVGSTIAGLLLVFMFFDSARDLVGA